jgi:hypothetical protein
LTMYLLGFILMRGRLSDTFSLLKSWLYSHTLVLLRLRKSFWMFTEMLLRVVLLHWGSSDSFLQLKGYIMEWLAACWDLPVTVMKLLRFLRLDDKLFISEYLSYNYCSITDYGIGKYHSRTRLKFLGFQWIWRIIGRSLFSKVFLQGFASYL